MRVLYRKLFLKDLKKLKGQPVYQKIYDLVFNKLAEIDHIESLSNVKAMKGYPNRYRIRIGDYRIGIERRDEEIEVMRVLHRREFYRYFP